MAKSEHLAYREVTEIENKDSRLPFSWKTTLKKYTPSRSNFFNLPVCTPEPTIF